MRALLAVAIAGLIGCAPAPPPVEQPKPDLTAAAWYGPAIEQLAAMTREAERLITNGRFDEASTVILKGQPLQSRLLAASHPTLGAMEAASDLDDLYGRMLLRNKRYGFARGVFQMNVVRWKHWKPETAETARRMKVAMAAVAECDRRMAE